MKKGLLVICIALACECLYAQNTSITDSSVIEPWRQSQLKESLANVPKGKRKSAAYQFLKVADDTIINLLGRTVILNKDGFIKQVQTFFKPDMTGYNDEPANLLYEGIHFHFTKKSDGKNIDIKSTGVHFTLKTDAEVQWESTGTSDVLQVETEASLLSNGAASFQVKVTALQDMLFKDIVLHIPFQKNMATYLMGLGQKGGPRPELVEWKWGGEAQTEATAWIGNTNAGLQFLLQDEKPSSGGLAGWDNTNKGGITVGIKGSSMLVNAYNGERSLQKGDVLYYNYALFITPFHTLNTGSK